jgi:hypothetical protein
MVARRDESMSYRQCWEVLRASLSYGKLSRALSLETNGVIGVDSATLQKMETGAIEHPRTLLGGDLYLTFALGLVLVRTLEECDVAKVLSAAEGFLVYHLGEQSGYFLAVAVFHPLGDRSQLSRHTLRMMIKRMLHEWQH